MCLEYLHETCPCAVEGVGDEEEGHHYDYEERDFILEGVRAV